MRSLADTLTGFLQPISAPAPVAASAPATDGPAPATPTPDFAGVHAGLEALVTHRRRYALDESPVLNLFTKAIPTLGPDIVEPSIKIDGEQVFAERVNLYFHDRARLPTLVGPLFELYERVGAMVGRDFDYGAFDLLVEHGLRLGACRDLILGVDIRPDPARSRLKLYVLLDEPYTDLVEHLWQLGRQRAPNPARADALSWLVPAWTRLIGVDFGFDGTSTLKVYVGAPAFDYQRLRDSLDLNDAAATLMRQSPFCIVSALDPRTPLHLLLSGDIVLELVPHRVAETIERRRQYILSVPPGEFTSERLSNMNLYYGDLRLPGGDDHVPWQ
ncbi:DUF5838 family protein [Haliangium sp.]|uniref:DUF5838 family protein n=1 Tax=Haliangium sp. TaxID=2663208 RepID=UPI003D0D7372